MKPLPSRLESFWIGVIAGIVLALTLVPMIAKAGLTDSISTARAADTEERMTRLCLLLFLAGCASPPLMPPAVLAPEVAGFVPISTTPEGGTVYGPPKTSKAISADQRLTREKKGDPY